MTIALKLFGPPRLERDGRPLELGLKKALALLAFLAAEARPRSRDQLTALLWPEAGATEARSRLRRLLYRLHRQTGETVLVVEGETLRLADPPAVTVDLADYRHCLRQADGETAEAALESAAACYQGDFLAGFSLDGSSAFDDWQYLQAEDLRQSLARVLSRLAAMHAAGGDYDAALPHARRLLTLNPLDEAAQRRLMELLAAAGQPAEALRQFDGWRDLLARELGVEPQPQTRALAESIRGGRTAAGPGVGHRPETRYARSGDLHIAYQVLGEGELDLVYVPGFISHLEQIWDYPPLAGFLRELAGRCRMILLDRRGVGLSDRVGYAPDLEDTARDVLAVMDAAGSRSAVIFGVSEGGPAAIHLAARHPRRVQGLVLWGTTARPVRAEDAPWGIPEAVFRRWIARLVAGWGGPAEIELFAPSVAAAPRARQWWAGLLRSGSSPGAVAQVLEAFMGADVRELLSAVQAPALVAHRGGDDMLRIGGARYLAERLPRARLLELSGADHWFWSGDPGPLLRELRAFLGELTQGG